MLKFRSLAFILLLCFSSLAYTDDRNGEHSYFIEAHVGMLGETSAQEVTIAGGAGTSYSGVDNDLGYKLQGGYKFHLLKQFSLAGHLGYLSQSTKKTEGYILKTTAFDVGFALQFHPTGKFFFRGGVNYPVISTFTRELDNKTDEAINGGEFEGTGKIGYDIVVGYDVYSQLHIFIGYSRTRLAAKKSLVVTPIRQLVQAMKFVMGM